VTGGRRQVFNLRVIALAALPLASAHAVDGASLATGLPSSASIDQSPQGDERPNELRLYTGVTYSDNIDLAPTGQEQSDIVISVVPGLSILREGGRASFTLDYQVLGLLYVNNSDRNDLFNQMRTSGMAELVPESLFLEADASYYQRSTASDSSLGQDLVSRPGEFSNVLTYRLSPYARSRFGNYASTDLRYDYWNINYQGDSGIDSENHRIGLRINSGDAFRRFGWSLRYDRAQVDYNDGTATEFQNYWGRLRANISEQLSLYAEAGRDNDSSDDTNQSSRRSGNRWRVGVLWTPTNRTSMEGFYADRYFGSYFGARLRHRFRSSTWAFDYEEEPSTAALITPDVTVASAFGAGEGAVVEESGDPVVFDEDFPNNTSQSFLRRRATLAVQGQRARVGWGARVFFEQRDYESSQQDETRTGGGLNLSYRVAPRTQALGNLNWLRTEGQSEVSTENSQLARLGLQHELGPNTALSAFYRYVQSDGSEGGTDSYRENRLTLVLTRIF